MMSHVNMRSSTTYHILLAEFGELPIELYTLELTMGFQQRLAHLSPSLLVNKATSLSWNLAQIDNHLENIMGSISLGPPWQPNHIKQ